MSNLAIKITFIALIFIAVLAGTYPLQREALDQQSANDYENVLLSDLNKARTNYEKLLAASPEQKSQPDYQNKLLDARENLARLKWEIRDLEGAKQLLEEQLSVTWAMHPNEYNPRWVKNNQDLANIFRDLNYPLAAIACNTAVLEHDRQYKPADKALIARDLNNLGLNHYLNGQTLKDKADRAKQFMEAKSYYQQALALMPTGSNSKEALPALSNLYLALRDLDMTDEADKVKAQIATIQKTVHRVCREP